MRTDERQACLQELCNYWTLFRNNFPCGDDAKSVNENNTKEEQLSVITTLRKQLKKHGFSSHLKMRPMEKAC